MSKNLNHISRLSESDLNHALYFAVEFAKGDWNASKELREFFPNGYRAVKLPGWWYCQLACDIVQEGCLSTKKYPPIPIRKLASLVGSFLWYALAMAESDSEDKEGCRRVLENIVKHMGPLRLSIFKRLQFESSLYIEPLKLNILDTITHKFPVCETSEEIFQVIEIDKKLGKKIQPKRFYKEISLLIIENRLNQAIEKTKELHKNGVSLSRSLLKKILFKLISKKNIHTLTDYLIWMGNNNYLNSRDSNFLFKAAQKTGKPIILTTVFECLNTITPENIFVYNSLLDVYIRTRQIKKAEQVVVQMSNKGVQPDIITYGILINGYSKTGQVKKAQNVFDQMIAEGLQPELKQYSALIDGYSRIGEAKEAQKIFDQMLQQGIEPDVIAYETLINAYGKAGQPEKAQEIFTEISKKGLNLIKADMVQWLTCMARQDNQRKRRSFLTK